MPAAVESALRYFVGERTPLKPGRDAKRMYLNELDAESQKAVVDFFTQNKDRIVSDLGEGPVTITRAGNLKIGRITMQRKGGDAGRESAKMLQFKINPVQLFDAK